MGPEYPGEGAVKAVTAGSNSDEGVSASAINWDTINWDILKSRKQKMEALSKDTTKKRRKSRKSRKKGNRISGVPRNP